MVKRQAIGVLATLLTAILAVAPLHAQEKATLWSFLGIPQAFKAVTGQTVNRRGNHPNLEKAPPLKKIADLANLESDVPAIKAAAEIKQAEDLAPQKIKAIKYLASIGCGCYDKDGKITDALVAAMAGDCTEEVRLEAVRAVAETAQGERCDKCSQRNCCNDKIVQQLALLAYERDEHGCWVEPSGRVRREAAQALRICCPTQGEPIEIIETPGIETPMNPNPIEGGAPLPPPDTTTYVPAERIIGDRTSGRLASYSVDPVVRESVGAVVAVDVRLQRVHVNFLDRNKRAPIGSKLSVFQKTIDGPQMIGELVVTDSALGTAFVSPVGNISLDTVQRGNVVVANQ